MATVTEAPMFNQNKLKLGIFSANCSSGMAVTKVPERWVNNWQNNLDLVAQCDQAGLEFMLPIARWIGYGGETDFHGNVLKPSPGRPDWQRTQNVFKCLRQCIPPLITRWSRPNSWPLWTSYPMAALASTSLRVGTNPNMTRLVLTCLQHTSTATVWPKSGSTTFKNCGLRTSPSTGRGVL